VREDYLVCPTCGRRLRTSCPSCRKPIDPQWRVCPYCEVDVHAMPPVFDRV
jgi:predicted amidophosphoribosyltransferase